MIQRTRPCYIPDYRALTRDAASFAIKQIILSPWFTYIDYWLSLFYYYILEVMHELLQSVLGVYLIVDWGGKIPFSAKINECHFFVTKLNVY